MQRETPNVKKLSLTEISTFQKVVYDFYNEHNRPMAWRANTDPYYILVSEVMLQQTQVDRVMVKFKEFIQAFPTVQDLAEASLHEVLKVWSGLGYNRRGMWLHEAGKRIVDEYGGHIPEKIEDLITLKGIGHNTAAAILAYAYNKPVTYVETNIRAVYIHHFFEDRDEIDDKEILELLQRTIDTKNPREWYWALMDYGTYLKKIYKNPARRSKHHTKQSTFEGSRRQIRGKVLRALVQGSFRENALQKELNAEKVLFDGILSDMEKEGLVVRDKGIVAIK